jgi:fimbrial chaperone protein
MPICDKARWLTAALMTMLFALAAVPASAGPLAIAPTTVEIAPGRNSAVIEVLNDSDASVDLQFRAFAWTQKDGRDELTPTDDLAISPAIATVAPHAKQIFRVLRTHRDTVAGEHSFRLKLNEIPRGGAQIAVNLEFSTPVFETVAGAKPALSWTPTPGGVELANTGVRRIKFARLALVEPDGARHELEAARSTYLLGGTGRRIALPGDVRPVFGTRLVGVTDTGPTDVPLAVAVPR